jgi:hypothetical protein
VSTQPPTTAWARSLLRASMPVSMMQNTTCGRRGQEWAGQAAGEPSGQRLALPEKPHARRVRACWRALHAGRSHRGAKLGRAASAARPARLLQAPTLLAMVLDAATTSGSSACVGRGAEAW